jgi:hypothetical protein
MPPSLGLSPEEMRKRRNEQARRNDKKTTCEICQETVRVRCLDIHQGSRKCQRAAMGAPIGELCKVCGVRSMNQKAHKKSKRHNDALAMLADAPAPA